ncbi:hypothetical protein BW723_05335 [Polaribacter reichenbachii]|uniref:Uncharacterized protein n=2 Tax=Polaribacter reichenbachii TaxID=996801 RepID=A0A1B8TU50_9FLAO|nr:hypothetical protein BW723_05335 [Polaribacter reichenbachii]AUC19615.1 hypothetical protein BTO17_13350 [Polaribacter reichenbachii]OBY63231.1 hypothetical protein LPB301_10375 [Polaribacter reichenbachii]
MELTKEQLQRVEHYLNVKRIDYIDIRLEIFDHIISDIEVKMESKKLDFETSFYAVTDKWNKHLKDTSSFYFGIMFSAPKMVINKAKKSFRKWFFILFIALIIPQFLLESITFSLSDSLISVLNLCFQIVSTICFIILLTLVILKKRIKTKSTYSFILKTQGWNLVYFPLTMFNSVFLKSEGGLNPFSVGLLTAFISIVFCYFHFYKKHKEAIKKYKIS